MKSIKPLFIKIICSGAITGILVICIILFNHPTRMGTRHTAVVIKSQSGDINGPTSRYSPKTTRVNEVRDVKHEVSKTVNISKVVIPGRTIQSSVFIPGIQNSISVEGANLIVPSNAMKQSISLSVTGLLAEDLPPIPAEITNVTKNYPGYRFLPHGKLFKSPATVALAFDNTLIPEGYTSDDIYTYYFDDTDHRWKALERDSVNNSVSFIVSNTLHFTDMINGIIKIPESPQTEGYVPTSMKNIKAADPATGIFLIDPPSANNKGEASISLPIEIPDGRAGMQPQLMLQYSSVGNSSWTGYGWDLPVPAISVDVAWGVPHFDSAKESETYLKSGEQLTPVAHRSDYVARTSEKRFYQRIEGECSKIIRHGNKPTNYWWEVTSKDGERNFYGGFPETGLDTNAVLNNTKGIGYWALTETRDVHDNRVDYKYDKLAKGGQQLYLGEITYTGHSTGQGPYKIALLRNDTSTYQRKDARIDARLGFIQKDSALLRRINITYNDRPIRSYTLHYKDGAFFKTLLESISTLDTTGKVFYSHRFDYYDDIKYKNGYRPYENMNSYTLPDDNMKKETKNKDGSKNILSYVTDLSAINSSTSWGFSAGAGGSFGFDPNVSSKSTSIGGNGSYNQSEATGIVSLIDINGDGLPDKVFKDNGHVYYRPNLTMDNNQLFGEKRLVKGIYDISYSKTTGSSGGAELNLPAFIFAGYNHSSSKTITSGYFADFNADGLIDYAQSGKVYYNHINALGDPEFKATSDSTPNPLRTKSIIIDALQPDTLKIQDSLKIQFPLQDMIRMWKAPYNGIISIHAPVNLIKDPADTVKSNKDGVIVSIQYHDKVLKSAKIGPNFFDTIPLDTVIAVTKDYNIYFRVQSIVNGLYDHVHWDPLITYTVIDGDTILPLTKDANRKTIGRFKASEDFVLCGLQSIVCPDNGTINIRTLFSKPLTTDSITVEIISSDNNNDTTVLKSRTFNCKQVKDSVLMPDYPVLKDQYFQFRIKANTNIDWSEIKWDINAEFRKTGDTISSFFKSVPDFDLMYVNTIYQPNQNSIGVPLIIDSGFYRKYFYKDRADTLHPIWIYPDIKLTDNFILSLKIKDTIAVKQIYPQLDPTITAPKPFRINVSLHDTLFFDYHSYGSVGTSSPGLIIKSELKDTVQVHIKLADDRDTVLIRDTLIFIDSLKYYPPIYSPIKPDDKIFGSLYRGWGYFSYNGNNGRDTLPVNEDLFKININQNSKDDFSKLTETSDLTGLSVPSDEIFSMMVPYADKGCYLGNDLMVYLTPDILSSSRRGQKDIKVESENYSDLDITGYSKITEDKSNSLAGGVSAPIASLSYSTSSNNSITTRDMMDMNGDGYPDLLTPDKIQYTGVLGGLINQTLSLDYKGHYSVSHASGFVSGGNFVVAKNSNSSANHSTRGSKAGVINNIKNSKNSSTAEKTSKSTLGAIVLPSFNLSTSSDFTYYTMLDINGDGLPDKVCQDGKVWLNSGYSFSEIKYGNFNDITKGTTGDYSLGFGAGMNYGNNSITAGINYSSSKNASEKALMDVNGDGLPDILLVSPYNWQVCFNTGTGFSDPVPWERSFIYADSCVSVGGTLSSGFTVGVTFFIFGFPFKFCVSPNGTYNQGLSRSITQISDIDGDGMPDYLESKSENGLSICLSSIGRTNMLKTVYRPMGSNFTVDYKLTHPTYRHPGSSWVLASLKIFDGLTGDGIDTSLTTFDYEDGFYNRHEREFYGYSKVKTHYHDTGNENKLYRTLEQQFSNNNYYTKGLLLSETLSDGENHKQAGSKNSYNLYEIHSGRLLPPSFSQNDSSPAYVSLDTTKNFVYSGSSSPQITTKVTYTADTLGNIIEYTDYSTGKEKDRYTVSIAYHSNDSAYLYSIPSKQEVTAQEGIMRRRETSINKYGDITQVRQYLSDNSIQKFDMEYDEFGNLTKITRPANYKGERLWYAYQYDPVVHSFIIKISDAYGYSSSSEYDYMWEVPVESTDMNNQKMRYTYDECGRPKTITGPYELALNKDYTIAFNYHPEATVPYARTLHYDSTYNNIETYTFSDGLGRPVQVKKSALLFNDENSKDTPGYIVSGKTIFDAFGRVTEAYQPVFEDSTKVALYNPTHDNINPTTTTYDVLDRELVFTLPDGSQTINAYSVGSFDGENMEAETTTDALGHQSVTFTDASSRKAASILKSSSGDIITSFEYNAIGELLSATDPKGNKTHSVYDKLGRRISVNQPDAGLTEFTYDLAGNILTKITANLRKHIPDGGSINYHYDRERLTEIVYPKNVQNRVNYLYGDPGASHNRVGRIVLVQDASGGQEFFYGPMGEVIKSIRTVQLGESDMRTWIYSAFYDSWNRTKTLIYPDGEKVTYTYNRAGNLAGMEGEKLGRSYTYISRVGYDKFERQAYLKYGNGAVTIATYESERQRLDQMSVTSKNKTLMENKYTYDALNNILSIKNSAEAPGDIGGYTSHTYSYDDLNRLSQASGIFRGKKDTSNYTLSMQYDLMGNLTHKIQNHYTNGKIQAATTCDFGYKYNGPKPDVTTEIGEKKYIYDENGNQTSWQDTLTNDFRQLYWDEEDRIKLISDNGYINNYVYDAAGERVIKSSGGSQGVFINGAPVGIIDHSDNNYTVYVSPYFTLQNEKFTKHYYAGSSRVTSKIGNGQFENQYRSGVFEITAGKVDYINRQQQLQNGIKNYTETLSVPPGPPTMKGINADPYYTGKAYPYADIDTLTPRGWPKKPVYAQAGGPPGAPIQWGDEITNDNVEPGFGYAGNGNIEERLCYFYHSDHLGSTSYVTDINGDITQYVAYLPYGETLTEQHGNWDSPYKYNAKELDMETGLYYYGARYYDPKTGRWISADLLGEEYPGLSPFAYCANNTINCIDPDGKRIMITGNQDQKDITLVYLQKLTNDELVLYGDEIIIKSKGTQNRSRNLSSGTALIRELKRNSNKVTISLEDDPTGSYQTPDDALTSFNGKGCGSKVVFSLSAKVNKVWTNSGRPETISPEIALGHELVHAQRASKGIQRSVYASAKHYFDKNEFERGLVEEFETVGIKGTGLPPALEKMKGLKGILYRGIYRIMNRNYSENSLRKEQGYNQRTRYYLEVPKGPDQ